MGDRVLRRASARRADGAPLGGVDLAAGLIHVRRGWDEQEGEIALKSRAGHQFMPGSEAEAAGLLAAYLRLTARRRLGTR